MNTGPKITLSALVVGAVGVVLVRRRRNKGRSRR